MNYFNIIDNYNNIKYLYFLLNFFSRPYLCTCSKKSLF